MNSSDEFINIKDLLLINQNELEKIYEEKKGIYNQNLKLDLERKEIKDNIEFFENYLQVLESQLEGNNKSYEQVIKDKNKVNNSNNQGFNSNNTNNANNFSSNIHNHNKNPNKNNIEEQRQLLMNNIMSKNSTSKMANLQNQILEENITAFDNSLKYGYHK